MWGKTVRQFIKVVLHLSLPNLLYIKKHLALVLKKIVNVLLSVLQTNLNKAVNIYYTLPKWIGNMKMMQCFSTIKTWMRIMLGKAMLLIYV